MMISASGYSPSMQITSSILLFTFCTCLLLIIRPGSSVALNIPSSVQSNDSEINTNSIIPESGTKLASSTSTKNALQTPTSSPTLVNCTKNSTEKIYNQSAMIESVRRHFLAKLKLTDAPSGLRAGEKLEIPPALISSYYASLQAMQKSADEPQNCHDKKITHYSRSVNLYSPDYYVSAQAILDHFVIADDDDGKSSKPVTTSSDTDKDTFPPVLYNLRFDHLDLARVSRVWSVTLKLYKRKVTHKSSGIRRGTNPSETVKVFQVQRKSSIGKLKKVYQLFTTKNVRSEHEGYVSFDITEGIKRWREGLSQQQSLELDILIDTPEIVRSGLNLPPIIMFDVPTYGKGERKAQLVVETLSDKENLTAVLNNAMQLRRKRTTGGVNSQYCFDNPNETNCCIREATINFHRDLHWDWVILPETFNPNYCSGGCQNSKWPHATKSTSFLTQLRENNPTAAAEPCCVPHEMKSITVLMVINGHIMLNDIPDMVVKSCICR